MLTTINLNRPGVYSHFAYHKDKRKTGKTMSTPQMFHCVPLQLLRRPIKEALATPHPAIEEKVGKSLTTFIDRLIIISHFRTIKKDVEINLNT